MNLLLEKKKKVLLLIQSFILKARRIVEQDFLAACGTWVGRGREVCISGGSLPSSLFPFYLCSSELTEAAAIRFIWVQPVSQTADSVSVLTRDLKPPVCLFQFPLNSHTPFLFLCLRAELGRVSRNRHIIHRPASLEEKERGRKGKRRGGREGER
jgi:hypothetical protein